MAYWLNYAAFAITGIIVVAYAWAKYGESESDRVVLRDLALILTAIVILGCVAGIFVDRVLMNFLMVLLDETAKMIFSLLKSSKTLRNTYSKIVFVK